jgi:hypothetical protein
MCNIFLACEPLTGKRIVKIAERKTRRDWAYFLEEIALQQEKADKITLIMDNLNTHIPGSLYEVFPPAKAKAIWDRFEFVCIHPKTWKLVEHGRDRIECTNRSVLKKKNGEYRAC